MTKRISEEREQQIVELYDSGMRQTDISKALGIEQTSITKYLRKNGRRKNLAHDFDDDLFATFTAESCYWSGFLAADGGIDKGLECVKVSLQRDDKQHLAKLLLAMFKF